MSTFDRVPEKAERIRHPWTALAIRLSLGAPTDLVLVASILIAVARGYEAVGGRRGAD